MNDPLQEAERGQAATTHSSRAKAKAIHGNACGQREWLICTRSRRAHWAGGKSEARGSRGTGNGVVEDTTKDLPLEAVVVLGVRVAGWRSGGEVKGGQIVLAMRGGPGSVSKGL